ncbi:PIG-L deacetylase family protein [uncultured Methylobacterium sp.]|uniref:PIG-L deacetylase family protein n=1 Tax=uncultured Methylobacterium sp. TaxID=157278 RepID=UPI0035CBF966
MRADAFLPLLHTLPVAGLTAMTGGRGLVVVAPHPDDESLGCGGLIAEACRRGDAVRLVVVSDGCGSHPNSRLYPRERLRALRQDETLRAVAALGLVPGHVTFLGLPDAHVPRAGPEARSAADRIAAAAQDCDAGAVFVTWRHDPHCDHAAAAAIVDLARPRRPAMRAFAYPVWGWTLPPEREVGPAPRGFRLDIEPHRAAKRRAVAAHASQTTGLIADDPEGFRLPEAMVERLCGPHEWFIELPE